MSETLPRHAAPTRSSLADLIGDQDVVDLLRGASSSSFEAASQFWRTPFETSHLSPRMTELILLAMHGAASALNVEAIERHVNRAVREGASASDVVDVMVTIVGLANHALYSSVPILEEELRNAGHEPEPDATGDGSFEAAKQLFVEARGFWNAGRENLARLMPEYFLALTGVSTDSWLRGSLTVKERELICVGIDCTITHYYEPGLRAHIRLALENGATREEILDVFQLAGLMGLDGYVIAGRALAANLRDEES